MATKKNTKKKGAPKGNEFWRLVKEPTGRPKKFTPAGLWKEAQKYFEWVSKHPLKEQKVFGSGKRMTVKLMRPFTLKGLFIFLDIDNATWDLYKVREDFIGITKRIQEIIYTQKFEGAAVGLLKENLIARELGLMDKQNISFDYDNMPEELIDKILQAHVELAKKNKQLNYEQRTEN